MASALRLRRPPAGSVVLRAEGVVYPGGTPGVLLGAALVARAGSVVALIGPTAAGKTVLMRCLSGEVLPAAGGVEFVGVDLASLPSLTRSRLRRQRIGRTTQAESLIDDFTAAANVAFPLLLEGRPDAEARAAAYASLADVGMSHHRETAVVQLSAGERRLVELMRAMVLSPWLLLLDEPFAGLDVRAGEIAAGAVARAAAAGAAVVVASVDPRVEVVANHVVLLDAGRTFSST